MWLINKLIQEEGVKLDDIPAKERGNWLGEMYTRASKMVSLGSYTIFPMKTLIIAQVDEIQPHPADKNWKVVKVNFGSGSATVVCGGSDYEVGDKIAYCPVGGLYKGKVTYFILDENIQRDFEMDSDNLKKEIGMCKKTDRSSYGYFL